MWVVAGEHWASLGWWGAHGAGLVVVSLGVVGGLGGVAGHLTELL